MATNADGKPLISVLTPVYNEAGNLDRYVERITEVLLTSTEYDFEVVFIEDGSTDESWAKIQEIAAADPRFRGVRLSRNYGSHVALSAGFAKAAGDAVTILACDLQDPPEVVLEFIEKWRAGAQVVWGRRRNREDSGWRVLTSNLFFFLIKRFGMPKESKFSTGSFLLVDRLAADCFRQFGERNRITFALVAWTGFDQEVVEYDRARRIAGVSGWTFGRMFKTMHDAFVGFSFLPVRLITFVGMTVFGMNLFLIAYLLYCLATRNPVPGWTGIMVSMTFFFAIQFLVLGIVGEYLYRIYTEVVARPLYFISSDTGNAGDDAVS